MKILEFEHEYAKKFMLQRFLPGSRIFTEEDILAWRGDWQKELKGWHSPYKLILDLRDVEISSEEKIQKAIERNFKFFQGFFLKNFSAFSEQEKTWPFELFSSFQKAAEKLDLRLEGVGKREPTDFRSVIQIQNHFNQHAMEVNFVVPVTLKTKEELQILKSKIMNQLTQWHTPWNLIIDCGNFSVDSLLTAEFSKALQFFKALHLKEIVGYGGTHEESSFSFPWFRFRHKAVAKLEGEGKIAGDAALCQSNDRGKAPK